MDLLSLKARPSVGLACLRSQLRHSRCQACQDACPLEAINFSKGLAEIDADTCVSCARCLFVCPTTAITDLTPPLRAYREAMLIAPFSHIPPTPEELLLWHDEFRIRAVEMDADEHPGWLLSLAELNLRLARLGKPAWTLVSPPQNSVNSGRRRWLQISQATACTAAVSPAVAPAGTNLAIGLDTSRCYLCGACVKICPQQAISLTENELILDPLRCNGCKACENVCFPQAIAIQPSPSAFPVRHAVFRATCSSCRQPFASWHEDASLCPICQRHGHGMREA